MEVDESVLTVQRALDAWARAEHITMVIKEVGHLGLIREEVNAKDLVEDLWLVRKGHKVVLRMLLRGKATPYLVYASLFDKPSWVGAADKKALREEVFQKTNDVAYDFFWHSCISCGQQVPVPLLSGKVPEHCPKCSDMESGVLLAQIKEAVF